MVHRDSQRGRRGHPEELRPTSLKRTQAKVAGTVMDVCPELRGNQTDRVRIAPSTLHHFQRVALKV